MFENEHSNVAQRPRVRVAIYCSEDENLESASAVNVIRASYMYVD